MKFRGRFLYFFIGAFFALSPFAMGVAHASNISISTCTQLQAIGATSTEPVNGSYVLTQNVDCSATATWNPNGGGGYYGFSPIPDFTGFFNGAGYSINNLYISTTTNNVGLFSTIDATSTVENLTFSGGSISGGQFVGSAVGEMYASSTIQNVSSNMTVASVYGYVGGLVGYAATASTTVASSSASGSVSMSHSSAYYAGGLVGATAGTTISNSYSSATITDTANYGEYIGGLVGYTDGTGGSVVNSYATGNIVASGYEGEYIGGLIGDNVLGNIASSSASGSVTVTGTNGYDIGGLVGNTYYSTISNSYATGLVTGTTTSEYEGGFVGDQEGSSDSINQCYSTGNVIGGNYSVGGFAGGAYGSITKSFSTGNVTFPGVSYLEYDGGFAGFTEGPVSNDYSTGNFTVPANLTGNSVEYVGGFDGFSEGTISNSYEADTITGAGGFIDAGGFVGYNEAPIINSFSTSGGTGLVASTSSSEGYFVGIDYVASPLTNDAELVQGTPAVGEDNNYSGAPDALLATHGYGTDESTLSNFYSTTEPVYAQASTTAWNFSSIWTTHANALPTLQWYSGVTPSFTITATAGTGGTISNAGAFSVLSGANQSYTITPNSGYTIASVLVDGTSVGAVSTYTFTNVTAGHTISVTFTASTPTPTTTSGGGTSGGGTVENQVTNLITGNNTPAAIALMNQYPTLFSNGTGVGTSTTASTVITSTTFTRSLTVGSTGKDVLALQKYLNAHGFVIATKGPGSVGHETTYFGKATRTSLAKFQKAKGISPATGYFGSITRAYIASHS